MERRATRVFKVRGLASDQKFGVVARTLRSLMKKGADKLQLANANLRVYLETDGTLVDEEYFTVLENNTCLVISKHDESWPGVGLNTVLQAIPHFENSTKEVLETFQRDRRLVEVVQAFLEAIEDNSEKNSRDEDPDWFEGVAPRFKQKQDEMRHRCETRMRGYLREAIEYKNQVPRQHQRTYDAVLQHMKTMLRNNSFNQAYFDKSPDAANLRLCNNRGRFSCQGAFNADECRYRHKINPYANRESRIRFSIWNLDHRIEKSRAVLPSLKTALEQSNGQPINWIYFYSLLFTRENLKLVEIVCHDKSHHNLTCDDSKFYIYA